MILRRLGFVDAVTHTACRERFVVTNSALEADFAMNQRVTEAVIY
jgi:hypothetical protein